MNKKIKDAIMYGGGAFVLSQIILYTYYRLKEKRDMELAMAESKRITQRQIERALNLGIISPDDIKTDEA